MFLYFGFLNIVLICTSRLIPISIHRRLLRSSILVLSFLNLIWFSELLITIFSRLAIVFRSRLRLNILSWWSFYTVSFSLVHFLNIHIMMSILLVHWFNIWLMKLILLILRICCSIENIFLICHCVRWVIHASIVALNKLSVSIYLLSSHYFLILLHILLIRVFNLLLEVMHLDFIRIIQILEFNI